MLIGRHLTPADGCKRWRGLSQAAAPSHHRRDTRIAPRVRLLLVGFLGIVEVLQAARVTRNAFDVNRACGDWSIPCGVEDANDTTHVAAERSRRAQAVCA